MTKTIFFLKPSSFCIGVERAINMLEQIISENPGKQIYCVHEIVHNPNVINHFKEKGIVFVDSVNNIKEKEAVVCFSAHGTNRIVLDYAKTKFEKVYNLECLLVNKVYKELEAEKDSDLLFYIGKEGHAEAIGVTEYAKNLGIEVYVFNSIDNIPKIEANKSIAVLSQTTLNFENVQNIFNAIKEKYPNAKLPLVSDICKATYERQNVIINNQEKFDTLIVIGGKMSSNTKELCKIGEKFGKQVFFGESLEEILESKELILGFNKIAITGGASTPLEDINKVYNFLLENNFKGQILSN